ncbi:Plant-specific TFIIB-related protein 1 [Asimina triloba]
MGFTARCLAPPGSATASDTVAANGRRLPLCAVDLLACSSPSGAVDGEDGCWRRVDLGKMEHRNWCSSGPLGAQGKCGWGRGRWARECSSCGRVVEEIQSQPHDLFFIRANDSPLSLVTPDLFFRLHENNDEKDDDDPFEPTGGFITAFSTWSLHPTPIFAASSFSFSGHLAQLERSLLLDSSSSSSSLPPNHPHTHSQSSTCSSSGIALDNLRAYLQIVDVASILGVDRDISDHAFHLFRDCSSTTCLRNRSVEALATAALVHAIREAQQPRTLQGLNLVTPLPSPAYNSFVTFDFTPSDKLSVDLLLVVANASWLLFQQEISTAANLPQKEIGKYIKILGEALKLSQPINSNSIAVHMPRFCTLLQLNKSAQELAAHIGEVVVNKCFCTRRNPISISAAAIYLACQLEDKRKTQAEICKVTGLTEVTLRKVYKELLENWDDLLPPNYTPAVPPEKAFPMTMISSARSSNPRVDATDISLSAVQPDKVKQLEGSKPWKEADVSQVESLTRGKEEGNTKSNCHGPPLVPLGVLDMEHKVSYNQNTATLGSEGEIFQKPVHDIKMNEILSETCDLKQRFEREPKSSVNAPQSNIPSSSNDSQNPWPFHHRGLLASGPSQVRFMRPPMVSGFGTGHQGTGNLMREEKTDLSREMDQA